MDVNLVSPFLFFSFLNSRAGGSIKYCPILLFLHTMPVDQKFIKLSQRCSECDEKPHEREVKPPV